MGSLAGRRAATLLLAAELLFALTAVAWRFRTLRGQLWSQDDAYISFRYARNLVRGHGLVYNPGERVEGYTNPLWTVLSAAPLALGQEDPLGAMHALSLGLWILTYLTLLTLGVRLFREGNLAAPLAPLPLLFHDSFNLWFVSGMENPTTIFFLVAALLLASFDPVERPVVPILAGAAITGLLVSRHDGMVPAGAICLALLILWGPRAFRARRFGRTLRAFLLPVLLVFLPWTVWRLFYYGDFFPNTYYAKAAYLPFWSRGWEYLQTHLSAYRVAPLVALAPLGVIFSRGATRRFLVAAVTASAAIILYVVRLGGDFMEWRFLAPATGALFPAIVIGAGAAASDLARRLTRRPALTSAAALVAGVLAAGLLARQSAAGSRRTGVHMDGQETIRDLGSYTDRRWLNWEAVGRTYNEVLPRGIKVATSSAGIIPYYLDRPILDLHGLNDPVIARVRLDNETRRRIGHDHFLQDRNEMRRRGAAIYLIYPRPTWYAHSLITRSKEGGEVVSARLPGGNFVDFVILDPSRVDREAMRREPRLVFFDEARLADKTRFYLLEERFAGWTVVDRLDLENEASSAAHAFGLLPPAGGGEPEHTSHAELMAHEGPRSDVVLEDDGVVISNGAEWVVRGVRRDRDLVLIARHGGSSWANFRVEVNGRPVPDELRIPQGDTLWGEAFLRIPRPYLSSGENRLRLLRGPNTRDGAEVFHLWFLQEPTAPLATIAAPGLSEGAAPPGPR